MRLQQSGDLRQAEVIYRRILADEPDNGDALHLLGLIYLHSRKYDTAVDLIRQAIRANKRAPIYHNNLGVALQDRGELNEALACYRSAAKLEPGFAEAHGNIGNALRLQGKFDEAEVELQRALVLQPDFPDAHCNLGKMYYSQGKSEQALSCYQRAIEINPYSADAHNSLGLLLNDQGKVNEAIACYQRAFGIKPDFAEAFSNLGIVLQRQGQTPQAIANFERALALNPGLTEVNMILGNIYEEMGNLETAFMYYRRVPGDGIRIKMATMLPAIPLSNQEICDCRRDFDRKLGELTSGRITLEDPLKEVGQTNFFLAYHGLNNRDLQIKTARLYEKACPTLPWTAPHCLARKPHPGPIRIGFISKYLHRHSIGKTTRGLLAKLGRDRFHVSALFVPPVVDDEVARFIRTHADQCVDLPASLEAARQRIAELELDILFYQDIGMEPFTYFLAFARLAPVQCVSYGHPDTTGIRNMDYFVSNDLYETGDAASHYSERLFQLHDLGTLAYYYRPDVPGKLKDREAFGLPPGAHLYVCPQTLFKFHPDLDVMLGNILRADPQGQLVLIEGKFPHWTGQLQRRFEHNLPDVLNRVLWLPAQKGGDFINLLAVCDVMLDTPHFNGMNTSLEAFAVGTPVVTLPMTLQRGRHTFGMYKKMGIHDCIAESPGEYVKIAVQIGTHPPFRQALRDRILAANFVLYEDIRVVQEFERFFTEALARVADQA